MTNEQLRVVVFRPHPVGTAEALTCLLFHSPSTARQHTHTSFVWEQQQLVAESLRLWCWLYLYLSVAAYMAICSTNFFMPSASSLRCSTTMPPDERSWPLACRPYFRWPPKKGYHQHFDFLKNYTRSKRMYVCMYARHPLVQICSRNLSRLIRTGLLSECVTPPVSNTLQIKW